MKFFSASLLLLLLPSFTTARVGTQNSVALLNTENGQVDEARALQQVCTQCKTIYVAFHLLQDSALTSPTATLWTDEQIALEIVNLNNQWSKTSFKFELRANDGIDRQVNDAWNQADLRIDSLLNDISTALRVGGPTTVNIFVNDGAVCGIGGVATQDLNINMFPVDEFVRTDRASVCGSFIYTSHSWIMSHEIGHWLGLKHTFEGGCNGEGDGIADTPAQAFPTNGCPGEGDDDSPLPDTCTGAGVDPINNFMDYSSCKNREFTDGQNLKMYDGFVKFREKSIPCADDEAEIGFEFLFDSEAWRNRVILTKWGVPPSPQNFQIMDANVDYSNKMAFHSVCLPPNTMYEVKLTDSGNDGIQSPGYFKYSLNGEEAFSGGSWSGQNSYSVLLAGGPRKCAANQGRFKLEIQFDNRPTDIYWDITKASDNSVVVDQSATTYSQAQGYISNFVNFFLVFDQCLDNVPHNFNIRDINGDGMTAGYFKLSVNGEEVHTGAPGSFTQSTSINFPVAALPLSDDTGGDGPTPVPTQAPVEPTSAPTPGLGFCFSASSTVQVMGSGKIKLADVKLGDRIHVGKDVYEAVYSFGHFDVDAKTEFLEIKTDKTTLHLSRDHMIFGTAGAVPASMVQVGDLLVDGKGENVQVQSIKSIVSTGAIAPFTPSGKVVVDDVLASSFVAFSSESHLSIAGIKASYQWLAHSFEVPHRLFCNYLTQCTTERYTDNGVSQWVDTPRRLALWMMSQNDWLRSLLGLLVVATFAMFNVIEFLVLHPISVAVGTLTVLKFARRGGVKQV